MQNKLEWAESVGCTVPSRLGEEKEFNPYMRVAIIPMIQKRFSMLLQNNNSH
jgi:hypothetical protein